MSDDCITVYRGVQASAVDMVEAMLEAQGLEPRRLGRADAALVGVGMYAIEQLIEVPTEHAERARELIAASTREPDAAQVSELEAQALQAQPPREARELPDARWAIRWLIFALVLAVLWWAGR